MDQEMNQNEMEQESPETAIVQAVNECFQDGGEAYGKTQDQAIDAVIAKLEGMKTGESMGGLGAEEEAMELGEPV